MAEYEYRAKDGPEKIVEGVIDAATESAAIEKISALGYVPLFVHPQSTDLKDKPSALFILVRSKKQNDHQLMLFSRHLSSLFKSGVPILNGLYLLAEQEKDPVFRQILSDVSTQIKEGAALSQALASYPETFPPMYISLISAGETSGALPESLSRMADYLKKQEQLRSKIGRALAYPILLSVAGFGTIIFIMTFVVPKLSKLFVNLNRELPLPTRMVMALGNFMGGFWIVLLGILVLAYWLVRWLKQKPQAGQLWDLIKLQAPSFGNFVMKVEIARFARTLEISLSNGIAFLEALRISTPTLSNSVLINAMKECYEEVQKGEPFGKSLRRCTYVPHFVTDLILIGEESGRLEEVLAEISDTYEQETDDFMMTLTTLIEPMMILGIGAVVGFIVIAMMLPMFEISAVV